MACLPCQHPVSQAMIIAYVMLYEPRRRAETAGTEHKEAQKRTWHYAVKTRRICGHIGTIHERHRALPDLDKRQDARQTRMGVETELA